MTLTPDNFFNWINRNTSPLNRPSDTWIRQYYNWLVDGKIVTLADGRRLRANEKRTRFYCHRVGSGLVADDGRD